MKQKLGKQGAEVALQTQRNILQVAGQQFAARGFSATSLRDISAVAGTSHGLIRHHFGTKEKLWQAVVDDYVLRMAERHLPLLSRAHEGDPVEILKGFATNFMRQSAESPEISKLLIKDCSEPGPHLDYLVAQIQPLHQSITPVFKRVQEAGFIQEHDADSFFVFLVALGAIPFTLDSFVNEFYREDITGEAGINIHIERVLSTLFGPGI